MILPNKTHFKRHIFISLLSTFSFLIVILVGGCDTASTVVDAADEPAPTSSPALTTSDQTPLCENSSNLATGVSGGIPWGDGLSFGVMAFENENQECKLRISMKSGQGLSLQDALQLPLPARFAVQGEVQEFGNGFQIQSSTLNISGEFAGVSGGLNRQCVVDKFASGNTDTLGECFSSSISLPPDISYEVSLFEAAIEFPVDGTVFESLATECEVVDPVCENVAVNDPTLEVQCGGGPSKSIYENDRLYMNNWPGYEVGFSPLTFNNDPEMPSFMPEVIQFNEDTGTFSAPAPGDATDNLRTQAHGTTFQPQYDLAVMDNNGTSPLEIRDRADVNVKYTCPEVAPTCVSISNADFEQCGPYRYSVPHWPHQGAVDCGSGWPNTINGGSVDLNGSPGVGAISQSVELIPAVDYVVSFDAKPNAHGPPATKLFTVSINGTSQSYSVSSLQSLEMPFRATSETATLSFRSDISGAYGAWIDNVSICPDS